MDIKLFDEPLEVLAEVVKNLEKFGVPYFVGGSLASSLRGEFRMTNDFDLICEFNSNSLRNFISSLKKDFYIDEEVALKALKFLLC